MCFLFVFWAWDWKVAQVALIFTTPGCYLEMLEKLYKQVCKTVGPSLAASLESLVHHRNVASLTLLYRYCAGKYSSELGELIPIP